MAAAGIDVPKLTFQQDKRTLCFPRGARTIICVREDAVVDQREETQQKQKTLFLCRQNDAKENTYILKIVSYPNYSRIATTLEIYQRLYKIQEDLKRIGRYSPYIQLHAFGNVGYRRHPDGKGGYECFPILMSMAEQDCGRQLPKDLTEEDIGRFIAQVLMIVLINAANKLFYVDRKSENFFLVRNECGKWALKLGDLDRWEFVDDEYRTWRVDNNLWSQFVLYLSSVFSSTHHISCNEESEHEREFEVKSKSPNSDLKYLREDFPPDIISKLNDPEWRLKIVRMIHDFESMRDLRRQIYAKLSGSGQAIAPTTAKFGL